MSQKGGTYHPSQVTRFESSMRSCTHQPDSNRQTCQLDKGSKEDSHPIAKSDKQRCVDEGSNDEEWELVTLPEDDENGNRNDMGTPTNAFSSHFDFTVGWGQRKLTLLSWDLKVESQKSTNK